MGVLILVVMEDSLGPNPRQTRGLAVNGVLILVVMEDSLGPTKDIQSQVKLVSS